MQGIRGETPGNGPGITSQLLTQGRLALNLKKKCAHLATPLFRVVGVIPLQALHLRVTPA
jgi:hypothetical protein